MTTTKESKGQLYLLAAVSIWGAAPVATYALGERFSSSWLFFLRLVPTGVAFFLVYVVRSVIARKVVTPVRGDIGRIRALAYSLFGGVAYNLFISLALVTTSASVVGIVLTTEPVWIVFIDSWARRQMPSKRVGFSLIVAISASLIPLIGGASGGRHANSALGVVFATLAAVSWGLFTVLAERWNCPAFDKSAQLSLTSAPLALLAPFVFGGVRPNYLTLASVGEIATVSLGSNLVAMVAWIRGVSSGGSQVAALFLYLQPIATIGLSALLLHQSISALTILSLILVVGSVINVSRN